MWSEPSAAAPLIERLAAAFACELAACVGSAAMADIRARNALPAYAWPICASHDHCDANECMAEAFAAVMGRDILPDHGEGMTQEDCDLWNQAWGRARRAYLTA